jgi:hypothetical protein
VWKTDFISPISSSDWDEVQFSMDDSTFDSSLDLLGTLPSETDMTIIVSDDNISLKTGSLSSCCLLLNREDR